MAVTITSASCTAANGTISSPDMHLSKCYLENAMSMEYQGEVTYPKGGAWSATFTNVPNGSYTLYIVGDGGGQDHKSASCP
jgi:hypothetical protein